MGKQLRTVTLIEEEKAMKRRPESVPERVGLLRPLRPVGSHPQKGALWLTVCDCGNEVVRAGAALRSAEKRGLHSGCEKCVVAYVHEARRVAQEART